MVFMTWYCILPVPHKTIPMYADTIYDRHVEVVIYPSLKKVNFHRDRKRVS